MLLRRDKLYKNFDLFINGHNRDIICSISYLVSTLFSARMRIGDLPCPSCSFYSHIVLDLEFISIQCLLENYPRDCKLY